MSVNFPIIAVSCDFDTVVDRRGATASRYLVAEGYVRAVERAGGFAVLLPHQTPDAAADALDRLGAAGVLITGGDSDVPPAYYGQTPRPRLGKLLPARTAFEFTLIEAALMRHMPILGVCGGMQLLNVVLGGTLYQDLSERPGTDVHEQPAQKHIPHHAVTLTPGSLLAAAYDGASRIEVNSTHHQVVHQPGTGVMVSGVAPDGVIEGIEAPKHGFCLGVQWHPEALAQTQWGVYRAFVTAAQQPRNKAIGSE